jgi:hypothetical protein
MTAAYNIYCDESCHLENDRQPIMVLGALWCPRDMVRDIAVRIREIKARHKLAASFEVKWGKVSPARLDFYLGLLDYFFDCVDLHFRALIVANKAGLRHEEFGQDHDTWYYKMYFDLLKVLLSPHAEYRIYVDVKDTRTAVKLRKLHEVLCNNMYDFERRIIVDVQAVRSHEVEQVQLADLLIGTVSYANRGLQTSPAKTALVERMKKRSHYSLTKTTLLREEKVNLFRWEPREAQA